MGLSSSKSKSKTQETIAPNAAYAPQIDSAAATLKPAYDQSNAVAQSFQPALNQAAGYYGDVLGGKYLDQGNPYTQGMIDSTANDVTDRVNQQFMSRFGSGYHAKALAHELANAENGIRFGQYNTERGYQNGAGQNLAGIATTATALPMVASQGYAQGVNGLLGRYMTSNGTQETKTNPGIGGLLAGVLGAGLSGWAGGGFKL